MLEHVPFGDLLPGDALAVVLDAVGRAHVDHEVDAVLELDHRVLARHVRVLQREVARLLAAADDEAVLRDRDLVALVDHAERCARRPHARSRRSHRRVPAEAGVAVPWKRRGSAPVRRRRDVRTMRRRRRSEAAVRGLSVRAARGRGRGSEPAVRSAAAEGGSLRRCRSRGEAAAAGGAKTEGAPRAERSLESAAAGGRGSSAPRGRCSGTPGRDCSAEASPARRRRAPGEGRSRGTGAVAPLPGVLLHRLVDEVIDAALELARHLLERLPEHVPALEVPRALLVRVRAHLVATVPSKLHASRRSAQAERGGLARQKGSPGTTRQQEGATCPSSKAPRSTWRSPPRSRSSSVRCPASPAFGTSHVQPHSSLRRTWGRPACRSHTARIRLTSALFPP